MEKQIISILQQKLPDWAVKPHPIKENMTAIHPMAIIDVLNEAFGVGEWGFETEHISHSQFVQKTKKGPRDMFRAAVKGKLIVPKFSISIEQYGGSSNDDLGDALKGGATDALTKCASYLGVGASIYKGQGNIEAPVSLTPDEAMAKLRTAATFDELKNIFLSLPQNMKEDPEVVAMKDQLKDELIN